MVLFMLLVCCFNVQAEDGVTNGEIVLGQTCALSGSAQALGQGMRDGISAYFSKLNAEGGINGRKVRLISKDDGYEPDQAIKNTRSLLSEDKVFLLIGGVGTPTAQAIVPIAEENKVPFFGPFTGAEFLRNPFKKYVVNVRASYNQEMEKQAQYLIDQKKLTKIACFYQNDGYGKAGLTGITIALEKRGMKLIETANYERNTMAVKSGLMAIRNAKPEAIVMVGAYKPCAEFIKLARKLGMQDVVFCNISFVGSEALHKELGGEGDGCIISQVVVYPWDSGISIVKEYTDAMKQYNPEGTIGFISLEGYMVAKLFAMAAGKVQGELTRESFLNSIATIGVFDLGGVKLEFGPDDHQGMNDVFMTIIKDNKIIPL
ncbi:MAG: leucine/isoleucine/valine-binding protein [Desulfobacterium sp.]|nr:leucine/isoleucine/valine-binding protein [Desulfobacterium sp.]